MFSKLPELLDRNFAIGYFLPVTVFFAMNAVFVDAHNILPDLLNFDITSQLDVLIGTTILALVSWLFSIILLGVNRELTRLLEGYGKLNPFRIFHKSELNKFDDYHKEIERLDNLYRVYLKNGEPIPDGLRAQRNKVMWEIKGRFPTERRHILPTSFGNRVRAFEVYSKDMYGIDSIPGWSRLIAVLPKEYKEHIDDAKVFVDFWMNTFYLNILLLLEYLTVLFITKDVKLWFLPVIFIIVIFVSYGRACRVALLWGDMVKSAFDVFLPELWIKMGFIIPDEKEDKIKLWRRFNQAVIYGRPDLMPDRINLGKDDKQ